MCHRVDTADLQSTIAHEEGMKDDETITQSIMYVLSVAQHVVCTPSKLTVTNPVDNHYDYDGVSPGGKVEGARQSPVELVTRGVLVCTDKMHGIIKLRSWHRCNFLSNQSSESTHSPQVLGKRNERVPIEMTPDMPQAVQTLIKQRGNADIDCSNKYVFATRGLGHVNVWTALNECAIAAGCTNPELVSVTRLRKYV